jgi:hypothetical protein
VDGEIDCIDSKCPDVDELFLEESVVSVSSNSCFEEDYYATAFEVDKNCDGAVRHQESFDPVSFCSARYSLVKNLGIRPFRLANAGAFACQAGFSVALGGANPVSIAETTK